MHTKLANKVMKWRSGALPLSKPHKFKLVSGSLVEEMSLSIGKHVKYFKRNLGVLPSHYTSYDSSLTYIIYFCIAGLKVLGELDNVLSRDEQTEIINWTYTHLLVNDTGFRGSNSHNLGEESDLDAANLPSTMFCLSILALLEENTMTKRLNRTKILDYIRHCQIKPKGMFAGCSSNSEGPFGDHDPRHTYIASALCRMLQVDCNEVFDVDLAARYITSTKSYDGGLGDSKGSESHAGLTFCGIAALKLMDRLEPDLWQDTAKWLSKRQLWDSQQCEEASGGMNGRINKLQDTCYSFWTEGSLALLGYLNFIDKERNQDHLLNQTQHSILGGFAKQHGDYPDPMHTYLGLASLALQGHEQLLEFDEMLCLPKETVKFLESLKW